MNTRRKLELMKQMEQRNEQRRQEYNRIHRLYVKGRITKEEMERLLKKR